MEKINIDLKKQILNAKKSVHNPYAFETISAKKQDLERVRIDVETILSDNSLTETEVSEDLLEFNKLQKEYLDVLKQHEEKRIELQSQQTATNRSDIMADLPLDMNELSSISKLIPSFSGNKEELSSFLASLEIVHAGIAANKQKALFNYVFRTKLSIQIQNRVRQIQVPANTKELSEALTKAFKPQKSPNVLLNELTHIVQTQDSITKFANRIEILISELNEIQVSNLGEASREIISKNNEVIAFNSFKNGLKDMEIIKTIEASRVKTFAEAIEIAEETLSGMSQNQIMYQKVHYYSNDNRNNNNNKSNTNRNNRSNNKCGKCGGTHGDRCYAEGKNCNKCGKPNHFAKMCRSKDNNGRNNDRGNRSNNYRGNNRSNNYGGNQQNRNRNINQVHDQGNSQGPETVYAESSEQNQQNN